MELKAVVSYEGALAHYSLVPDKQGIYQANLVNYEGEPGKLPPQQIVLVKGVRKWVGSSNHRELLNELGYAIEDVNRKRDNTSPESSR